eukprot:1494577-Alexandrium_andersonii.AAC.1
MRRATEPRAHMEILWTAAIPNSGDQTLRSNPRTRAEHDTQPKTANHICQRWLQIGIITRQTM